MVLTELVGAPLWGYAIMSRPELACVWCWLWGFALPGADLARGIIRATPPAAPSTSSSTTRCRQKDATSDPGCAVRPAVRRSGSPPTLASRARRPTARTSPRCGPALSQRKLPHARIREAIRFTTRAFARLF
eukprot:2773669-Rhodomonas_salina.4